MCCTLFFYQGLLEMIKKTLQLITLMIGFSTVYAGDLSCGKQDDTLENTKKIFVGETKKNKSSLTEMVKANQDAKSKKVEKSCDELCADKEHCEEKGHDCDENCGDHKNHDHKH